MEEERIRKHLRERQLQSQQLSGNGLYNSDSASITMTPTSWTLESRGFVVVSTSSNLGRKLLQTRRRRLQAELSNTNSDISGFIGEEEDLLIFTKSQLRRTGLFTSSGISQSGPISKRDQNNVRRRLSLSDDEMVSADKSNVDVHDMRTLLTYLDDPLDHRGFEYGRGSSRRKLSLNMFVFLL